MNEMILLVKEWKRKWEKIHGEKQRKYENFALDTLLFFVKTLY